MPSLEKKNLVLKVPFLYNDFLNSPPLPKITTFKLSLKDFFVVVLFLLYMIVLSYHFMWDTIHFQKCTQTSVLKVLQQMENYRQRTCVTLNGKDLWGLSTVTLCSGMRIHGKRSQAGVFTTLLEGGAFQFLQ